ncbi:type IX secretion system PorP/SprF family membrane protein [Pontibacter ummariensis]|uniref:Type IX secretion system membrane protein, PorP/SprF family n=1 Tax=Pontibacter ummariensis TaxID=1610492 RepID=A0A239GFC4_9BACT|nr:PorP/SprF family type IX secretion system membrane protein [Pontibacter ummariensis]PRY11230.1 type IX secretion system PorP/SprF family membrane protein [Pontibacter ummariensis]SNS67605.1 type IX secretion system membrane protein, PorP/SprF family [Pontibacter ummariensis]
MKRVLLLACTILLVWDAQAQNRKQVADLSQYKHYYNPSLTGFEGSVIRTLYRSQWTGFEDAPTTIVASAELGLDSERIATRFNGRGRNRGGVDLSSRHALGITAFHDKFGPSKETQFALSYGSGIRLSEQLTLRWGAALAYTFNSFDGNKLTLDQENDPRFQGILGQNNRSSRGDINLGVSLTNANYYLGYAMQDVTEGKLISAGDEFLSDLYARKHMVQAGYRTNLSEQWGLVTNGLYQYDVMQKSTVGGQVKAVYQNTVWAGGGYRSNQAYNLTAGVRLNELRIAYAYESPVQQAQYIGRSTNEIAISYSLTSLKQRGYQLLIW